MVNGKLSLMTHKAVRTCVQTLHPCLWFLHTELGTLSVSMALLQQLSHVLLHGCLSDLNIAQRCPGQWTAHIKDIGLISRMTVFDRGEMASLLCRWCPRQ